MANTKLPSHLTRRVSLSKAHLRTELGAELLSICQTMTADGRLADEEIRDLQQWLSDAVDSDLPAISYLRAVATRILVDGIVTPVERRELYKAVESVLPPEVRRQAATARREAAAADRVETRTAKEREREKRRKNARLASANFMVAGVRHEGRRQIIRRYARQGESVRLSRDSENRHSRNAIKVLLRNAQHIGFVPEDDAVDLAPILDQGARVDAWITKILGRGRVPIPVVQAILYASDSTVEIPANRRQSFAIDSSRQNDEDIDELDAVPEVKTPAWVFVVVGVAILILIGFWLG